MTESSIICNTEAVRLLYEKQYPKWREKFIVINNGFDPDGFQGVVPAAREDNRIRIGYFGKIYAGRDPGPLLSVVRKLVDSGRLSSESIEFVFYGASSKQIQGIAQKLNVTDLVAAHPSLPYTKALCEMAACDVLLLINSPETDAMHIPAKLFEYMGLKKPILALAGPGAVGDLMESHHFGVRIDPQEPERLEETLLRFMENIRSGKRNQYLTDELWRFSRPEQTKQLVGLLDNAR